MIPRERITLEKEVREKNPNGSPKKNYEVILSDIPVERRKAQVSVGDGVNVKEEFIDMKIVLWCRYHPVMEEAFRVLYNTKYYRIIDINRKYQDNSCLITCVKGDT